MDATPSNGIQTTVSTLEIPPPSRIAVLGVGLLGASVLRAARERLPASSLAAWSRSASSLLEVAAVAEARVSPADAARDCDCVVLAAPVDALPALLAEIAPALAPGAWVTDVGSTKRAVHAAARRVLRDPSRFVGGHPMAGSERSGAAEGRADLFVGRPCIVTSDGTTDPAVAAGAETLWAALGGHPIRMTPAAHDAAVAEISHLPHATASLLAALLSGREPRTDLAAGGLRDTTRVAAGDPSLWVPILLENADNLAPLLRRLSSDAAGLARLLESGDADGVRAHLESARRFRRSL